MVTTIKSFGAAEGAPGITVQETSAPKLSTLQGFGTVAVYASLKRGPMGVPIPVDNRNGYSELFGKPGDSTWHLFRDGSNLAPDAIDGIFSQSGGTRAWILRNELDGNAKKASVVINSRVTGEPVLKISAANEGRWGGYTRKIDSTPLILATDRTFTLNAPDVKINEFIGAKVSFSAGSGAEYDIVANSASDPNTNEVVFTLSSQYSLSNEGVNGPSILSGVASYALLTQLTGSIEALATKDLTGTITANETVLIGTGTAFNTELVQGGIVFAGGIARTITSVLSDTSATIDAVFPVPIEDATLQTPNKTVTGAGTLFTTELAVGDQIIATTNGNQYKRTVESITSDTELLLTSSFPEEVPVATQVFIDNLWIEGTSSDYDNEVLVGDYIVDPNRGGPARRVLEIDTAATPQRLRVDAVFGGGDFTTAQIVKQSVFAEVNLVASAQEGLAVEIGQGVRFPDTHFSVKVFFENTLVFSAEDVSLDPEDALYVEREINQGNIGYKVGSKEFQTWVTAEVLTSATYTTGKTNDIRPANGSSLALVVSPSKIYTAEMLDERVIGSLLYPDPYKVARLAFRVKNFVAPVAAEGTVSSVGTTVTGVATEFTEIFAPEDYIYNPETGETRQVISVTDDTTLIVDEAFSADLPAFSTCLKAGYFSFDGAADLTQYASQGDRYLAVFAEQLEGGYDGDVNTIPFHWTRYFDLDTNQLENVVFGLQQGLIRIIVPGISDVTVQKAAAAYSAARAFEFRGEIPNYISSEALAESFLNNDLGRNDALTLAFPSYGYISSPFSRGDRLIPITGDLLGMESRQAINHKGYHHPAAGISATLTRVVSLPVTVERGGQAILNSAGIQQIFELDANIVVFGNRSPALDETYGLMHVRRIQSSYVRYFMEARPLMQILYKPNQPETVEQILLFLRAFSAKEYKKGVYTNFLTLEDTVSIDTSPNNNKTSSNKDIILSVVKGQLELSYSYLLTGVVENVRLKVGPSQIVSAYTAA